jgi:endogenous inhibitor of DNA gyrase (YacG/DUF329 family)
MQEPTGHRQVKCPTCGRLTPFTKDNRWRPFCSERCKLIDLGAWFDESNRIPGRQTPDDDHYQD